MRAKVVVSGVGGLVEPKTWPKDIRYWTSKVICAYGSAGTTRLIWRTGNVIMVGSGCSAAQVVPELARSEANVRSITQLMDSSVGPSLI